LITSIFLTGNWNFSLAVKAKKQYKHLWTCTKQPVLRSVGGMLLEQQVPKHSIHLTEVRGGFVVVRTADCVESA